MAESKLREINEIVSSPENRCKNLVSLLLEAAAQVGETATFNYIDELLLSNLKLFTCEVKVGRLLKCSGTGQNKKVAKLNAAEKALEIIKNRVGASGNSPRASQVTPMHGLQMASPSAAARASPAGSGIYDSPTAGSNPIGSLQEMCAKNNWTPPSYVLIHESGEAHTKTFIMECKIESRAAQGQGKTKKSAKRLSAENMLSMIGSMSPSLPHSSSSRNPFRNFPDQKSGTLAMTPQLNRSSSATHHPSPPVHFLSNQLYSAMEYDDDDETSFEDNASGSFIDDISEEFCSSLEDRGKNSGFNVEYHDFSQKGYSGNYLCLVRLDTKPAPTVCSGMGPTKTCAHERAAQNALQYLNTVCS